MLKRRSLFTQHYFGKKGIPHDDIAATQKDLIQSYKTNHNTKYMY